MVMYVLTHILSVVSMEIRIDTPHNSQVVAWQLSLTLSYWRRSNRQAFIIAIYYTGSSLAVVLASI